MSNYEHVEHPNHYNGYDMEELKEIWKPVVGYEGIYEVSNIGRIKSLDRMKKSIYGQIVPHKGRFVKQSMHKGYCYVSLTKNGKSTRYCVHRLVAIAFIDNPHNKPMIDHINTNRSDNRVDNLRWVTQRENILNPISLASRSGKNHYNYGKKFSDDFREKLCKSHKSEYKPVLQIDKNTGEVIMEHESVKAAAIHAGVKYDTMSKCLSGITKSCKGYYWKRKPIEKKAKTYEMVNSPKHYSNFTCETIDMMVAIWGKERVADWCEITAFKYRMRMGTKPDNSIEQDLKKEQWYLNKAKELRDERVE